jgi:hypothetical protein
MSKNIHVFTILPSLFYACELTVQPKSKLVPIQPCLVF